jgi:hypothetical protein
MILTESLIRAVMKGGKGITNKQHTLLGSNGKSGWMRRLVGTEISVEMY